MSSPPYLKLRRISKNFGSIHALSNVDCSIERGRILGILGDNGSGKSTLIRILAGYHQPTQGQIELEGKPVQIKTPRTAKSLGISTVYQDLGLVNELSIVRNFFLGNEISHFGILRRYQMNKIVQKQLRLLGLSMINPDATVAQLSGGERQAIAFARACYLGTNILILDEPTSALSIGGTEKVFQYMQMAKEKNMAVLFITHNLQHAQTVCDDLLILYRGKKVAETSAKIDRSKVENFIINGRSAGKYP